MVPVGLFLRGCFVFLVALSFGRLDGAGRYAVVVGGGDAGANCLHAAVAGQASGREGRGAAVVPLGWNPQIFLGIDVVGVGLCALGGFAVGVEPSVGPVEFFNWRLRAGCVFACDLHDVVSESRVCAGRIHSHIQLFCGKAISSVGSAGSFFF